MLGLGCIYSQVVCVCALYGGLVVRRGRKLSLCADVRSARVLLRLRPRCCSGGLCGCGRAVVCSVVVPGVDWCSETPRCVGLSPRSPQARHRPTERRYRRGEIQTEQKTKKITSAGFPSVWCLSGVPEGLLIAGDHQTNIQTRGKSNSPPSRSRRRERGRRCSLLRRVYSRMAATWVRLVHCDRP